MCRDVKLPKDTGVNRVCASYFCNLCGIIGFDPIRGHGDRAGFGTKLEPMAVLGGVGVDSRYKCAMTYISVESSMYFYRTSYLAFVSQLFSTRVDSMILYPPWGILLGYLTKLCNGLGARVGTRAPFSFLTSGTDTPTRK